MYGGAHYRLNWTSKTSWGWSWWWSDVGLPQQTQNMCTTFVQRRPNVLDVCPTLYKWYTNVVCYLGGLSQYDTWISPYITVDISYYINPDDILHTGYYGVRRPGYQRDIHRLLWGQTARLSTWYPNKHNVVRMCRRGSTLKQHWIKVYNTVSYIFQYHSIEKWHVYVLIDKKHMLEQLKTHTFFVNRIMVLESCFDRYINDSIAWCE